MADENPTHSQNLLLGKDQAYPEAYAPELLSPIARTASRRELLADVEQLPFRGWDLWSAYELSWLDPSGKPVVATGEFRVPADSPNIIESKSLKYYLNSFNQSQFESSQVVAEVLARDLSAVAEAKVEVDLYGLNHEAVFTTHIPGRCVDELAGQNWEYHPNAALLRVETGQTAVGEGLYSHLLKTNCPVTGQPDWATVWVQYSGPKIDPASLLAYVVSFRQHQDFHESCVEKIFFDLQARCLCEELTVYARYTRRGGLDINPFRTNTQLATPNWRLLRQ